jgi:hypothetical protein
MTVSIIEVLRANTGRLANKHLRAKCNPDLNQGRAF